MKSLLSLSLVASVLTMGLAAAPTTASAEMRCRSVKICEWHHGHKHCHWKRICRHHHH